MTLPLEVTDMYLPKHKIGRWKLIANYCLKCLAKEERRDLAAELLTILKWKQSKLKKKIYICDSAYILLNSEMCGRPQYTMLKW